MVGSRGTTTSDSHSRYRKTTLTHSRHAQTKLGNHNQITHKGSRFGPKSFAKQYGARNEAQHGQSRKKTIWIKTINFVDNFWPSNWIAKAKSAILVNDSRDETRPRIETQWHIINDMRLV